MRTDSGTGLGLVTSAPADHRRTRGRRLWDGPLEVLTAVLGLAPYVLHRAQGSSAAAAKMAA